MWKETGYFVLELFTTKEGVRTRPLYSPHLLTTQLIAGAVRTANNNIQHY